MQSIAPDRSASAAADRHFERRMFCDGRLQLPDGANIAYWGFEDPVNAPGIKSFPSPLIRMREGETAQVRLDILRDARRGAARSPPLGSAHTASGEVLRVASFDTNIYQWQPRAAGTWLYQSHKSTPHDFEMGMYGLLIVDPQPEGSGRPLAFRRGPAYDIERLWVLDDIDPTWHTPRPATAAPAGPTFDPKYFLVNGVTQADAAHHSDVAIIAKPGEKLLIRLLNASFSLLRVSVEHFNGNIVSVDGTAIDTASSPWTSWIPVGPGKPVIMSTGSRHDLLIDLDPSLNPAVTGRPYKVVFEFLDLPRRTMRNANAPNPLHMGRIETTITVAG
ncbi:MAG: hypothetical protein HOP09_03860 [Hyphomicrobium sp.]|nr:hypothetical protein [Hyphomicrobium sp.]